MMNTDNFLPRVLFLIQLPPPVHGASMMNSIIRDSVVINKLVNGVYHNISTAKDLSEVGKFRLSKITALVRLYRKVLESLKAHRPDVVYITLSPHGGAFFKDSLLVILSKIFCKKVVFHLHGKGINKNLTNKVKRSFYKYIFRKVQIIHLSVLLESDLLNVKDNKTVFHFLPNGIPNVVTEISKESDSNLIKIIYLSNFIPAKGALDAIKAVRNLVSKGIENIHLDLVGRPANETYLKDLQQFVSENELSRYITFHAPKYNDDKIKALQGASIFILPSRNEALPISIIEAMMCGLAIVSTDQGAIPELVESNSCGLLSKPHDINTLTENLERLIKDSEFRNTCRRNARYAYLDKYTVEKFEKSFLNIIKKISTER